MYGQKFNPYSQFSNKNNQLYEEEYQQQDSEPLVEQVDPNYQPTQKQVRQYAVQTLGMSLPQDEAFLYLAREGLKAPLPPNWVPYQGRDGEVYYKHRITQIKTYDHPTDIQYMKTFQQQKQKMARKNLKSMNMKNSQAQMNPFTSNNSKLNNFSIGGSMISAPQSSDISNSLKLDVKLQQQFEQQLKKLQQKLKRQLKQFQIQQTNRYQNKIKKLKQQYQQDISKIYKNKNSEQGIQDKIRFQKQKLKTKLEEQIGRQMQIQIQRYQNQLIKANRQYQQVYNEDNQLKIRKYQQQKDQQFRQKQTSVNQAIQRANRKNIQKKKQKQQNLKRFKNELQNGKNKDIEQATLSQLSSQIQKIKQKYNKMIEQKNQQLQRQFIDTKRVLGYDQNAYIAQIASKKARIKAISEQKRNSYKNTQIQKINQQFQKKYLQQIQDMKQKIKQENNKKIQQQRKKLTVKLSNDKKHIDEQIKRKTQQNIQNIYQQLKIKTKTYQCQMNKKLLNLNQKFIKDIQFKSKSQNKDIVVRLQIKQKQMNIQNKQQIIQSLQKQLQLQKITYQLLIIQADLCKCKDQIEIDNKLKNLAKKYNIQYQSQKYLKFKQKYNQIKFKCKNDKQFLASIMQQLQGYGKSSGAGGAALLKQYNSDVRLMRENQQNIRKWQHLLKKAELNDRNSLQQLQKNEIQYQQIELKSNMVKNNNQLKLNELQEYGKQIDIKPTYQLNMQTALRDHTKFLTSMRSQLNRKLYQLRSSYY